MAQFYGIVQGDTAKATRCGTKDSGLATITASWQGAVNVDLYHLKGVDMVTVCLVPWHGKGKNKQLYHGPVSGEPDK